MRKLLLAIFLVLVSVFSASARTCIEWTGYNLLNELITLKWCLRKISLPPTRESGK